MTLGATHDQWWPLGDPLSPQESAADDTDRHSMGWCSWGISGILPWAISHNMTPAVNLICVQFGALLQNYSMSDAARM